MIKRKLSTGLVFRHQYSHSRARCIWSSDGLVWTRRLRHTYADRLSSIRGSCLLLRTVTHRRERSTGGTALSAYGSRAESVSWYATEERPGRAWLYATGDRH